MIYIQVPKYYDGLIARTRRPMYTVLTKDELLTIKEYASIIKNFHRVPDLTAYGVELKKTETVWFFGARLPIYTNQGQVKGTPVPQEEIKKLVEERLAELNKDKEC